MSCNICACKGSAQSSIFSGSELIWQYCELAALARGGASETPSKLFANHNALGQLTNHNTFSFSEGGPSSNLELIEPFVWGWGERYCNHVNYVKYNAIFEPPSMRAWSSTPPKLNQDFVKEHNRTPLKNNLFKNTFAVLTLIINVISCIIENHTYGSCTFLWDSFNFNSTSCNSTGAPLDWLIPLNDQRHSLNEICYLSAFREGTDLSHTSHLSSLWLLMKCE